MELHGLQRPCTCPRLCLFRPSRGMQRSLPASAVELTSLSNMKNGRFWVHLTPLRISWSCLRTTIRDASRARARQTDDGSHASALKQVWLARERLMARTRTPSSHACVRLSTESAIRNPARATAGGSTARKRDGTEAGRRAGARRGSGTGRLEHGTEAPRGHAETIAQNVPGEWVATTRCIVATQRGVRNDGTSNRGTRPDTGPWLV